MVKYYVRVSTKEQNTDRQLQSYDKADEIYIDKVSGKDMNRPELQKLLNNLKTDDIVVVKSLDRLSRSTKDMLELVEIIKSKGAFLQVIDFNGMKLDTATPTGEFFITMVGAIAQLERATIKQRQMEGIEIAKTKGTYKGRMKGSISLKTEDKKRFIKLVNQGISKAELARICNTTRPAIYRWIDTLKANDELK